MCLSHINSYMVVQEDRKCVLGCGWEGGKKARATQLVVTPWRAYTLLVKDSGMCRFSMSISINQSFLRITQT